MDIELSLKGKVEVGWVDMTEEKILSPKGTTAEVKILYTRHI